MSAADAAQSEKLSAAIARILDADDEGDGHEYIHAMRDAGKLIGWKCLNERMAEAEQDPDILREDRNERWRLDKERDA